VERGPRPLGPPKARRLTAQPFPNLEWILAEHGGISLSEISQVGCVAAAADQETCYAMLLRRKGETVLELLQRLDQAVATAAENNTKVDEVNPPGGFESTR
jgi:hypothetical protein